MKKEQASAALMLARVLLSRGQPQGGEIAFRRGLAVFQQRAAESPSRFDYRINEVHALGEWAQALAAAGHLPEAVTAFRTAIERINRMVADDPRRGCGWKDEFTLRIELGNLQFKSGHYPEAEDAYRQAMRSSRNSRATENGQR